MPKPRPHNPFADAKAQLETIKAGVMTHSTETVDWNAVRPILYGLLVSLGELEKLRNDHEALRLKVRRLEPGKRK